MSEHKQHDRDEKLVEDTAPEAVDDLDVPKGESEDVKGGADAAPRYAIHQAWPKKYTG
jgi:hypothetical protein